MYSLSAIEPFLSVLTPSGRRRLYDRRQSLLHAINHDDTSTVMRLLPKCHGLNWFLPTPSSGPSGNPLQVLLTRLVTSSAQDLSLLELLLRRGADPLFACFPAASWSSSCDRLAFSFALVEDEDRLANLWVSRRSALYGASFAYDEADLLMVDPPLFFTASSWPALDLMQKFSPRHNLFNIEVSGGFCAGTLGHYGVLENNPATFEQLLARGVDLSHQNMAGATTLDLAHPSLSPLIQTTLARNSLSRQLPVAPDPPVPSQVRPRL